MAEPRSTMYHVQALSRGLDILRLLAERRDPATVRDLHATTGLPKSSIVRLVSALEDAGLVHRVDDRPSYRLGHGVVDLANAYAAGADTSTLASPYLRELAQKTRQTANIGLLDGTQILHVCVEEPDRSLRFRSTTGSRDAVYCTALGKMLLSALPDETVEDHVPPEPFPARTQHTHTTLAALRKDLQSIRRSGMAIDAEEGDLDLRCLAVPIASDRRIAALSISGPAAEIKRDQGALKAKLEAVAARMSHDRELMTSLAITGSGLRNGYRQPLEV